MSAPSFAEVLDDALARARAGAARSAAWAAAEVREAADPFLFTRPFGAGATWTRAYPGRQGTATPGVPPRREPPPRSRPATASHALPGPAPAAAVRPARLLTSEQRHALEDLRALGAALGEDFTAHDLRREYRGLALALHPDRHAQASPAERVQLGEAFSRAAAAHRKLLEVVRPRH